MSKIKSVSLTLFFFLFYVLCFFSFVFTQSAPKVATLKDVKGDVQVQKAGAKSWIPATEGMKVRGGDKIKTKAKSEAKIVWDDGNVVKLSSYTNFSVNKAVVDNTTGADNTSTHLSIGKTFVNIKKAMAPGSSFEVSTPSAICGVRSTKFKVEVDSNGNTTVATYEGTVNTSAQGEEKEVGAGYKSKTKKGKPPGDAEPQDELDKIEQEEEADVVGKAPEEEKKEEKVEEKPDKPITLMVERPASDMETGEERIIIGGTTDPDAKLLINGVGVNPNALGRFEMEVKLNEGENTVTITATNPAGKTITITRKIKKIKKVADTTPPTLTITEPPDNAILNVNPVTVRGTTEPGAKVRVQGESVVVRGDGSFTKTITLQKGLNELKIDATDAAGNITPVVVRVTLDTEIILTISQPVNNTTVCDSVIPIVGTTEANAKVTIGGTTIIAGSDGSFTHSMVLNEGLNNITIKAEDKAKNISTASLKITKIIFFLTVSEPPDGLKCSGTDPKCTGGKVKVIGFTEKNAKVTVNGVSVYVDPAGNFIQEVSLTDGPNAIRIKAVMCNKIEEVKKIVTYADVPPIPPN